MAPRSTMTSGGTEAPPAGARRRARWKKWLGAILIAIVTGTLAIYPAAWGRVFFDDDEASESVGSTAQGSLRHGHPIPPSGDGYRTYSHLGSALGRQYVHGSVRDTLIDAFAHRVEEEPGRVFVLGETGWPGGRRMKPHRTHRNGLSVDVFVPLVADGEPASPSCWPWNLFCYGLELDEQGFLGDERIDFDALAGLLLSLDHAAEEHGLRIDKVIIAPEYVPLLLDTPNGTQLGPVRHRILRREVWVRHDDHIHIDFGPSE